MSAPYPNPRDLAGVPDGESPGDHTPNPRSSARGTSPSPIRGVRGDAQGIFAFTDGRPAPADDGAPLSVPPQPPAPEESAVEFLPQPSMSSTSDTDAPPSTRATARFNSSAQTPIAYPSPPVTPSTRVRVNVPPAAGALSGDAAAAAAGAAAPKGASGKPSPSHKASPQPLPVSSPFSLCATPKPGAAHYSREEGDGTRSEADSSATLHTRQPPPELPGGIQTDGRILVRVVRDGKESMEHLDPVELAHLYAQQQAALRQMQSQFDFLTVPDWVRLHPMIGPYMAEATGTFAWVLTLSLSSIRNQSIFNTADDTNVTCLPIGFMFTSMVFTFGYISGGHFNPAISLAVFLIRKMDLVRCLGYIICQLAAAFAAGIVAMLVQGSSDIFVPSVSNSFISSGIFSELIYTLAVALVVLNIGYSRQSGNFFYGFAVGMTMAAGSAGVGRISGGAFNPAAATGLQLAMCMTTNCDDLKTFWIYWLAPLVGAVAAALIYSQMSQPINTQILEDHKVLRDTGKDMLSAEPRKDRPRDGPDGGYGAESSQQPVRPAHGEGEGDTTTSTSDDDGGDGQGASRADQTDFARSATARGADDSVQRDGRQVSISDDVEMIERRPSQRNAAVLNDSLAELPIAR